MKISKPVLINGGLAIVIVGALTGGALYLFGPAASGADATTGTQLTSTVQQGTVSQTVSASGSISPVREVSASFAVTGTIATVDVAVGQTVAAGQLLGTLATADLQAAVDEAYTSYVHAGQNLTAAQAEPNAQVSQINAAKDDKTRAYNAWQSAKADLASATLLSPIAGLVTAVSGTVGGSSGGSGAAADGTTSGFVTIADVTAYVVNANIAEADIADVTVGQAATVSFPAIADLTATATVSAVAPTASAENSIVSYATTITLAAVPEGVRLGQTAEVAIVIVSSAEDALFVPSAAITTASDGTSTVDVVDPATQKTTTVTVVTGVVGDEGTEITSGLSLGDTIVLGIATPTDNSGNGQTGSGGPRGGFATDGSSGPGFVNGGGPVKFGQQG